MSTIIPELSIGKALEALRRGGLVAFPTDTLYALGANVLDSQAVSKVFQAKGRGFSQPLPIFIAQPQQLATVAREVPDLAWLLAERFWPGALTMVLHKSLLVPIMVTGGGDTVAVRVPQHPIPQILVSGLKAPITGTSANLSGGPEPVDAQEVRRQIGAKLDCIVDGGACAGGKASTIVDVSCTPPRVIRQGAIPLDSLEDALGMSLSISSRTAT